MLFLKINDNSNLHNGECFRGVVYFINFAVLCFFYNFIAILEEVLERVVEGQLFTAGHFIVRVSRSYA